VTAVGLHDCKGRMLTSVQLLGTPLPLVTHQSVLLQGVSASQYKPAYMELQEVPDGPFLVPIKLSLYRFL